MNPVSAAFHGFFKVLGCPGLVLFLFLANFLVALPAAVVMKDAIEKSIGDSLVYEKLRDGFDMGWYGEFDFQTSGFEDSFRPSIVGSGAFLDNIEAWINGSLFDLFPGLVGIGILYALAWALFLGGILRRYSEGAGLFRLGEFFANGGEFFFRFVRLVIISGVLYYGVYRFARWLFSRIEQTSRDITLETTVLVYVVSGALLVVFLLTFVNMAFDYAKIATVRENRTSMLLATLRGFGFVIKNFGRTVTLYYGLGALGLIVLAIYHAVAPGPGQSSNAGVLAAFLVGQMFLLAKLVMRLTFYASEIALFESRL